MLEVMQDQPWLDGKYRQLAKMVGDHFGVKGRNSCEAAVTRAYEMLAAEHAKARPGMADRLIRIHLNTIERGQKSDLRVITGAAAELRKLLGIGEPEPGAGGVGGVTGVSVEEVALLAAMRLTNAQRMAESDRLEQEIAAEEARLRAEDASTTMGAAAEPEPDPPVHKAPPPRPAPRGVVKSSAPYMGEIDDDDEG